VPTASTIVAAPAPSPSPKVAAARSSWLASRPAAVPTVAVGPVSWSSPTCPTGRRWGSCGLLLLAVGATFEERRRNLDAVVDRYTSLR
jgi:hypothetical protein